MDGALLKLMILPFDTPKTFAGGPPSGPPFIAQFNPTEFSDTYEIEENTEQGTGAHANPPNQKAVKPREFTFDLFLDGSGLTSATGLPGPVPSSPVSVLGQIELFRLAVGYSGKIHRNQYLQLVWGRLFVTTVIKSYSISYKLFNSLGLPVRATLSATFQEFREETAARLEDNRSSPDVAHAHLAGTSDTLPNVVHDVYGDPRRYIDVARANGLNTVRALQPGTEVVLPPVRSA